MLEVDHRKSGNVQRQAVFVAVKRLLLGSELPVCAGTVSAEGFIIGIKDNLVCTLLFHTKRVVFSCYGSEVTSAYNFISALINSSEHKHGVVVIIAYAPLEAVPAVILLPECRILLINLIERFDIILQLTVLFVA